jgi:hypothetical protein
VVTVVGELGENEGKKMSEPGFTGLRDYQDFKKREAGKRGKMRSQEALPEAPCTPFYG